MNLPRIIKHLIYPPWMIQKFFPPATLTKIEAAIKESETQHSGEIRFAIESALDYSALFNDEPCRERALDVFAELRVWDTEQNNGVLIFLLLADKDVEIIADRGINARVNSSEWKRICALIQKNFHEGQFEEGIKRGILEIGNILANHFPPEKDNPNELPNEPVIIR